MNLNKIGKQLELINMKWSLAHENLKSEKLRHKEQLTLKNNLIQTKEIAQVIATTLQQKAHGQLSGLVTLCLQTVFGDEYSFRIDFVMNRGRTEAKLILIKNGNEITDPLNNDSGGVADIASFALRVSCLMMTKPQQRKLLVLDEPFKFVSAEYKPALRDLLIKISTDLDMQIILVTHDQEYEIGKVITI